MLTAQFPPYHARHHFEETPKNRHFLPTFTYIRFSVHFTYERAVYCRQLNLLYFMFSIFFLRLMATEIFNFKRRKNLIINYEVSSLIRPLQSSISYGDKHNKVKRLPSIFVTQIYLKSNTILYKLLSTKIQISNLCSDSSILHIEEI